MTRLHTSVASRQQSRSDVRFRVFVTNLVSRSVAGIYLIFTQRKGISTQSQLFENFLQYTTRQRRRLLEQLGGLGGMKKHMVLCIAARVEKGIRSIILSYMASSRINFLNTFTMDFGEKVVALYFLIPYATFGMATMARVGINFKIN